MTAIGLGLLGPALIVASVLFVLHDLVFGGALPAPNLDVNSFYYPNHCFLGQSLLDGEIPGWNPYSMSGTPFAGDPQAGWMYLPAMSLYTTMSCEAATRWFIVVQPLMAGLALYWFARSERLSRVAATAGGLTAALVMCTSEALVKVWNSSSIAWTCVLLAVGSRFFRAGGWPQRIGWAIAVAIAWGQLALSHISHGVVVGTGVFACFALMRLATELKSRRLKVTTAGMAVGLLLFATVAVNLAVLLPRANIYAKTTMGRGYQQLDDLERELRGLPPKKKDPPLQAYETTWGLRLSTSPGSYVGGAALLLSLAWLWSRDHRPLGWAVLAGGLTFYLLSLKTVAAALSPWVKGSSLGDIYLHAPDRYMVVIFPVIAVLVALGVDAWIKAGTRSRVLTVLPGALLWGLLPLIAGATPSRMSLFAVSAALALIVLFLIAWMPRLALLLPILVAADISTSSLSGQRERREFVPNGIDHNPAISGFGLNFAEPTTDGSELYRPGEIEKRLSAEDAGRVLGVGSYSESMIHSIESSEGYNPVQLLWYWAFSRSVTSEPVGRRTSEFRPTQEAALDLLDIRWYRSSGDGWAPTGSRAVVSEDGVTLHKLPGPSARVSVVPRWTVADSAAEARDLVTGRSFESSRTVVLQEDPGIDPGDSAVRGEATYRSTGTQGARVEVSTSEDSLLLIRNTYDPHWEALVDGVATPVLRADYVIQAVVVPPGTHTVELRYDDPSVRFGILASSSALGVMGLAALVLWVLGRRTSGPRQAKEDEGSEPVRSRETK